MLKAKVVQGEPNCVINLKNKHRENLGSSHLWTIVFYVVFESTETVTYLNSMETGNI